ncbi:MAG: hypothetical protein R3F60_24155 [bacterium]
MIDRAHASPIDYDRLSTDDLYTLVIIASVMVGGVLLTALVGLVRDLRKARRAGAPTRGIWLRAALIGAIAVAIAGLFIWGEGTHPRG